jgi:hypothetical protein
MEQITSREANCSSSTQEILQVFTTHNYVYLHVFTTYNFKIKNYIFFSPELYDSVPHSPLLFPILSHINLL